MCCGLTMKQNNSTLVHFSVVLDNITLKITNHPIQKEAKGVHHQQTSIIRNVRGA